MKTAILTLGGITVSVPAEPKVVKEAKRLSCLSAGFWLKINNGELPYFFDTEKNELQEASYTDAISSLSGKQKNILWLKQDEHEKILQDCVELNRLNKQSEDIVERLKKYK
jgi:hypothetical protein